MNLLTRLTELLTNARKRMDCPTPEQTAFYLIYHGVNVPICNIGDKIYELLEDKGEWYVCEQTVTEVGTTRIFTSAYDPPKDDIGTEIMLDDIGRTVFFTHEEAEKAVAERSGT